MTALCRSIAQKGFDNISNQIKGAEMVEIRLETTDLTIEQTRQLFGLHQNMLATCRPVGLTEKEQTAYLQAAIEGGAAWVDVEIEADDDYRKNIISIACKHNCKVIVSYHNYTETPQFLELQQIANIAHSMGADVVKLACMCKSKSDVINLMNLYNSYYQILAIGMGAIGSVTRIAAITMNAPFTFVATSNENATAPGQISEDIMKILKTKIERQSEQ